MIEPSTLITYAMIVFGFVFIPGPATLLTMARAATSGTRVGIATGAGITVGDFIHTMLAVVGISAIIATSALLFSVVKYLGAAYLLYLGIRAILAKTSADLGQDRVPITVARAFRQAILAELLNPKTALFFLAFLPQFVEPQNGYVLAQLMIFGIVFALIGFFSTIVFAVGAGGLGHFLRRNPAVQRWQQKVVGGLYCALGIRLALVDR